MMNHLQYLQPTSIVCVLAHPAGVFAPHAAHREKEEQREALPIFHPFWVQITSSSHRAIS
jgi:hypothetical protein